MERVLILGSGGREHAIYLKLQESDRIETLLWAPGNGGVPEQNRIQLSLSDFSAIHKTIRDHNISLVVVGPEQPLVDGIREEILKEHPNVYVFGPDAVAARLEGSKGFSAMFMEKYGIPAGRSIIVSDLDKSLKVLESHSMPVVVKVDGLAAGKGVSIFDNAADAQNHLKYLFEQKPFGDAGSEVLLQEFLEGREASLFVLLNGKEGIVLPTAQDYKRAGEGNTGENTGGMGSFSPGGHLSEAQIGYAMETIVQPVLDEFGYQGVLYVGLMVHSEERDGISVVEFNCRFGDPETQVILPMMESDLLPYLLWSAGKEDELVPRVKSAAGYEYVPTRGGVMLNVVVSAKGYPGAYQKNIPLNLSNELRDAKVVHAGTNIQNGELVSSGGRIFNVVAHGTTIAEAGSRVYSAIAELEKENDFAQLYYRKDIGK